MEGKDQKIMHRQLTSFCLTLILAIAAPLSLLQAQEIGEDGKDRFVRLMSAQSVQLIDIDGRTIRKAEGPARFLHNNTWLICDTALWDVNGQIIRALGHVSLEQENTELTSDSLVYRVDQNIAEFRGALVQLRDKDNNTLRTRHLDYNTKDSVAVFLYGGAMRDKDGQLIESRTGTYDAKAKIFTFDEKVNMFTDSIFVKTNNLIYESHKSLATYPNYVEAWKDEYMLAADKGWYNRAQELFFFNDKVHLMSHEREGWCDSLYFDRRHKGVEMIGNVQVTDSVRAVSSLAGHVSYVDSLSKVKLRSDPVVIMSTDEKKGNKTVTDTIYFRADSIDYWTVKHFKIDKAIVTDATKRLEQMNVDAVANIRAKAAEEAAKKAAEAEENNPNRPPKPKDIKEKDTKEKGTLAAPGSKKEKALQADASSQSGSPASADSLAQTDSLAVKDSLSTIDSTKIGFVMAVNKVRVFRKSMQISCDSLRYCDLDSLARLYINPVIWNEGNHQYNCDSLYALIRNSKMDKANLMSNAFVHARADSTHFNQIRSTEMMAHFSSDNQLSRFDALGGATALFFINEKERIATANKAESKILSAEFIGGEVKKVTYYESPKSDAFPVPQMKANELRLKGYCWDTESRPDSPSDITSRTPRSSQRSEYASHPRAQFEQTNIYFKGYMAKVYREIERSDSIRRAHEAQRKWDLDHKNSQDTLSSPPSALTDTSAATSSSAATTGAAAAGTAVGTAAKITLPADKADKSAAVGTAAGSSAVAIGAAAAGTAAKVTPPADKADKSAAVGTAAGSSAVATGAAAAGTTVGTAAKVTPPADKADKSAAVGTAAGSSAVATGAMAAVGTAAAGTAAELAKTTSGPSAETKIDNISQATADTMRLTAKDSLYIWLDTVNVALLTPEQLTIYKQGLKNRAREQKAEEQRKKEEAFEKKIEEHWQKRESKWEEKDKKDALKKAEKDQKILDKKVNKEFKKKKRMMEQKAKEDKLRDYYKSKYLKKYTKKLSAEKL